MVEALMASIDLSASSETTVLYFIAHSASVLTPPITAS